MYVEQSNKMINEVEKKKEVQCVNCLKVYKNKDQTKCGLCGGTVFRIVRGREVVKK